MSVSGSPPRGQARTEGEHDMDKLFVLTDGALGVGFPAEVLATRSSSGWASQTSGLPRRPRRYSLTIDSRMMRYSIRPGRGCPPTPHFDCGPLRTLDIPARLPCPPPRPRPSGIKEAA